VERIDRAKSRDYVIVDLQETVGGNLSMSLSYEARRSLGISTKCRGASEPMLVLVVDRIGFLREKVDVYRWIAK
jgi:hypothetical protein